VRGWSELHLLSWRLGARALLRRRELRQALVRIVIPLDPSRYLELPPTIAALGAQPGERVLDLASPKLAAVALARRGTEVVSVDLFEAEVQTWRALAGDERGVRFEVGDGRALDHPDASFHHAYSISVLEHMPGDGAAQALGELARIVRPGGRVVVTLPYAARYHEVWRERPLYGDQPAGPDGRYFFERWYDDEHVDALVAATPALALTRRSVVRMTPNWHRAYARWFPWLIPLGPFFGMLARERKGPPGDVVRLVMTRASGAGRSVPAE
jgi:SAM-dependent methyltransferase